MTNLEWIRTLSAKELSDLLYDYWLPRGQYVWTDSRKGLVKMLSETYLERDCDKCKHQGNCYCVKGLGCPFESKDEPTISKMEQVDEPITQTETQNSNLTFEKRTMRDCYNCKRYENDCDCRECNYEPKDEPQTEERTIQGTGDCEQ